MNISQLDVIRWRDNSIETAIRLGYDRSILNVLKERLKIEIVDTEPPEGMWYGSTYKDRTCPKITIYSRNIASKSKQEILEEFRNKGVPEKTLKKVKHLFKIVPQNVYFEIINQSGMDHELIGHLYNIFQLKDSGEKAAVEEQIKLAKVRKGWLIRGLAWRLISAFAPLILYHHKKDEF